MKFTVHLGKGSNLHVLKYEKDLSSKTEFEAPSSGKLQKWPHNSVKGLNGW